MRPILRVDQSELTFWCSSKFCLCGDVDATEPAIQAGKWCFRARAEFFNQAQDKIMIACAADAERAAFENRGGALDYLATPDTVANRDAIKPLF